MIIRGSWKLAVRHASVKKPTQLFIFCSIRAISSWDSHKPIIESVSKTNPEYNHEHSLLKNRHLNISKFLNFVPIEEKVNLRPTIGTLVEFISLHTNTLKVGVIISDDSHFFRLNRYKVFTMSESTDGGEEMISSDQINFHLNNLVRNEPLYQSLGSINSYSKQKLNLFLSDFVSRSYNLIDRNSHLIPIIQAYYSKPLIPQQLDLLAVTQFLSSKVNSSQKPSMEFFYFGLHMHFQKDLWNYSISNRPEFPLQSFQSSLVPNNMKYFVNPINEAELLEHAATLSTTSLQDLNKCLKEYIESGTTKNFKYPKHLEDIKSNQDLLSILTLMKRYLNFDSTNQIEIMLSEVLHDICDVTPYNVNELLKHLNPKSDKSSQVLDYILPSSIKITKPVSENFKHLRSSYQEVAFAIPSSKMFETFQDDSVSEVAISLNTTAHNIWVLDIHIPDIASVITSESKVMKQLEACVKDFSSPYFNFSLFDNDTLEAYGFKENSSQNNAITVSIEYNLNEGERWNSTTATVELTELKNVKRIPISELNEIWRSRIPNLKTLSISNFFKKLFSLSSSSSSAHNSGKILKQTEVDKLHNFLTMIDVWHSKRSQERGSLENPFSDHVPKNDSSESDFQSYSYTKYIIKELELIVSQELYKLSQCHPDLRLIAKSQSILESHVMDTIEIKSQTMIPNYETSNFNEIVFLKDQMNVTPYQNYVAAIQFLKPVEITTTESKSEYVSKGLDSGFIEFLTPLSNYEIFLNHWQLLNFLQKQFLKHLSLSPEKKYKHFDLAKLYPKNTIPKFETSTELLKYYNLKIKPCSDFLSYKESRDLRYAKLKDIQEKHNGNLWDIYRCIILSLSSGNKASAWCFELGLQVQIELLGDNHQTVYQVGDQIICNRILQINPVDSIITLE